MARATYCYLVYRVESNRALGVFTVKHEMITAVQRQTGYSVDPKTLTVPGPYDIVRLRDGVLT